MSALVAGAPRLLWPAGAELGEGPLWDDRAALIYWLDIEGRRLHRTDAAGGARRSWELPARVGCAALTERPGLLLLGLESGLHLFRPDAAKADAGGVLDFLARPDPHGPEIRPNDGAVDVAGRLWFGTMALSQREGAGALHRLGPEGRCRCLETGWTIPNGPAFSPDGARLYWADSGRRCVFAFELGPDGEPRDGRAFLRLAEAEPGVPDGMAVDAEGCLWVALNGGGRVARYAADGRCLGEVALPTPAVSSCAFGGEGLATLFVTTARQGAEAGGDPDTAGALFAVPTRTRGLPAGRLRLGRWGAPGGAGS